MKPPIIIVDDEQIDRYVARRIIEKSDAASGVTELHAGDHLLELLDDLQQRGSVVGEPPPAAIVLLDINMPRLSGLEVLDELRDRVDAGALSTEDIGITIVTSSNNDEDRKIALRSPFVRGFTTKPLDASGLQRILEDHNAA